MEAWLVRTPGTYRVPGVPPWLMRMLASTVLERKPPKGPRLGHPSQGVPSGGPQPADGGVLEAVVEATDQEAGSLPTRTPRSSATSTPRTCRRRSSRQLQVC